MQVRFVGDNRVLRIDISSLATALDVLLAVKTTDNPCKVSMGDVLISGTTTLSDANVDNDAILTVSHSVTEEEAAQIRLDEAKQHVNLTPRVPEVPSAHALSSELYRDTYKKAYQLEYPQAYGLRRRGKAMWMTPPSDHVELQITTGETGDENALSEEDMQRTPSDVVAEVKGVDKRTARAMIDAGIVTRTTDRLELVLKHATVIDTSDYEEHSWALSRLHRKLRCNPIDLAIVANIFVYYAICWAAYTTTKYKSTSTDLATRLGMPK